ncbi:MAG: SAM-dependent methyltransferase [Saprospiraceae bacterium]|jgi:SAM-dependent methyltransferase
MQRTISLFFISIGFSFFISCGSEPTSDTWEQSRQDSTQTNTSNKETTKENAADKSLTDLIADYDPPNRELWQKPQLVIEKMGDLSNKTVADIGSGSGSFARRLTQVAKKVIAIEIDPRFVEYMDSIKRVELSPTYQRRFETRLATTTDSKIKTNEADIIIMVNTYLYVQDRKAYLKHLLDRLPVGGQLFIVDFKKKSIPLRNPSQRFRVPLFEVEKELKQIGFKNVVSDDRALDYQYIVIAEK